MEYLDVTLKIQRENKGTLIRFEFPEGHSEHLVQLKAQLTELLKRAVQLAYETEPMGDRVVEIPDDTAFNQLGDIAQAAMERGG